jgi:hypothetical protein
MALPLDKCVRLSNTKYNVVVRRDKIMVTIKRSHRLSRSRPRIGNFEPVEHAWHRSPTQLRQPKGLAELNIKLARATWGRISRITVNTLSSLSYEYGLSVAAGDLQLLDGRWYITHSGLLRLAFRRGCRGIDSRLQQRASDPTAGRWVFRATVYKTQTSKGFVGYGDADPSNTSFAVRGAEMRVAETRAVNRALRKAYGIGLCSVEELGAFSSSPKASSVPSQSNGSHPSNGCGNGQPRLRDQLCLLIRQYNLDPKLVKAYAADFCGTKTLSEASRDSIQSFIAQLARSAKQNRESLMCKLNSYAQPQEVSS